MTDSSEWLRLSEISSPLYTASADAAKFAITAPPVERAATTTTTSATSSPSAKWRSVHLYYIIQTHVHLFRCTI